MGKRVVVQQGVRPGLALDKGEPEGGRQRKSTSTCCIAVRRFVRVVIQQAALPT